MDELFHLLRSLNTFSIESTIMVYVGGKILCKKQNNQINLMNKTNAVNLTVKNIHKMIGM